MVGPKGIAGLCAVALATAAAIGASAQAGGVAKKSSFPAASNGRIVFASSLGGNENSIVLMNADGSSPAPLTPHVANQDNDDPSFSPDGSKIAFDRSPGGPSTGSSHVYVMNADGSNPVDLTPSATETQWFPVFSPNGKRIAFIGDTDDSHGDIWVMNADGSSPVNLTPSNPTVDAYPEWSPDGSRIYFDRDVDPSNTFTEHVFVMNADGSDQRDLGPGDGPGASPDGSKIAFARDVSGGASHIFVANTDGSGAVDLTPGSTFNSFEPRFSPDGRLILFDRDDNPAPFGFDYELHVMNADGSGNTQLTHTDSSFEGSWEYVYTCGGRRATIIGTQASEKIAGTKKSDVIVALGGNDKVSGKDGSDRICGGDGKDKLSGGSGNDKLYGQAGKDNLTGGKGKDKLAGGSGKDKQKQ